MARDDMKIFKLVDSIYPFGINNDGKLFFINDSNLTLQKCDNPAAFDGAVLCRETVVPAASVIEFLHGRLWLDDLSRQYHADCPLLLMPSTPVTLTLAMLRDFFAALNPLSPTCNREIVALVYFLRVAGFFANADLNPEGHTIISSPLSAKEDDHIFRVLRFLKDTWFDNGGSNQAADSLSKIVKFIDETIKLWQNNVAGIEIPLDPREVADLVQYADQKREAIEMNPEESARIITALTEAAEMDDFSAICFFAYEYYLGGLVVQNYVDAQRYLLKLVRSFNYYPAAETLGYIYFYGLIDGTPDYQKAYTYFSQAALAGLPASFFMLSDMYYSGLFVAKDRGFAHSLLLRNYRFEKAKYVMGQFSYFADICWRLGRDADDSGDARLAYYYYLFSYRAVLDRIDCGDGEVGDEELLTQVRAAIRKYRAKFFIRGKKVSVSEQDLAAIASDLDMSYGRRDLVFKFKTTKSGGILNYSLKSGGDIPVPVLSKGVVLRMSHIKIYVHTKPCDDNGNLLVPESGDDAIPVEQKYWVLNVADKEAGHLMNLRCSAGTLKCNPDMFVSESSESPIFNLASVHVANQEGDLDYLIPEETPIQVGDQVDVPLRGDVVTGTVTRVFGCSETELPQPIEKYRFIIDKK